MEAINRILFCSFFFLFYGTSFAACPHDNTPTSPIDVDSVSINPHTNKLEIGWTTPPDGDVSWYYIFKVNPNTSANDLIDSVKAISGTYYSTLLHNSNHVIEQYAIGSKDTCGNQMLTILNYHNTILLNSSVDPCAPAINLNWNAYDDFHSGTNVQYEIFVSENSGTFQYYDKTSNLNFTFTDINGGTNYQFYIKATENNGSGLATSRSNVITVSSNFYYKPQFLAIRNASVIDSTSIEINFIVDTAADVTSYEIYKSEHSDEHYKKIGIVNAKVGMTPLQTYTDKENITANVTSYFYRVKAINPCNKIAIESKYAKTILLKITVNNDEKSTKLIFSQYEGWDNGVDFYEVYRQDEELNNTLVAILPPSNVQNGTVDNVGELYDQGKFTYSVKAISQTEVINGTNFPPTSSASNTKDAIFYPLTFVPTTFLPGSNIEANREFKPIISYTSFSEYEITIFDRLGHQVFQNNDSTIGWNGRLNGAGEELPSGVYSFRLKYVDAADNFYDQVGSFQLLR